MGRLLSLRDGRSLAFRIYGREQGGHPVLFTHGNLNSMLFMPSWESSASDADEAGAMVIAVDRPGYGESTKHDGRSYQSWSEDVRELADELGLASFSLVGFSSGGPHAMAAAAYLGPERIASLALVSSDGPYAAMPAPAPRTPQQPQETWIERMYQSPTVPLDLARRRAVDNEAGMREAYGHLKKEHRKEMALADLDRAVLAGFDGAASDSVLESTPWGFEPRRIAASGIPTTLWHGDADTDVPIAVARYLLDDEFGTAAAAAAPAATTTEHHLIEGESHTLIRRHWKAICADVVSRAGTRATAATGSKL